MNINQSKKKPKISQFSTIYIYDRNLETHVVKLQQTKLVFVQLNCQTISWIEFKSLFNIKKRILYRSTLLLSRKVFK